MTHDVIVVGGSFAGQSAAMQLARARRTVLVIDAGRPRNRFADATHGFLGHDGRKPSDIISQASQQLAAYPTIRQIRAEAVQAEKNEDGFTLTLADGQQERAARIVLATGISDELLPIPGLQQRWGKTVLHCPYCHGFEFADRQLGVLASHPLSVHQATLIPQWGPTTYFTQGAFEPDPQGAADLAARQVRIVRSPIIELLGPEPELEAVRLENGETIRMDALYVAPRSHLTGSLAQQLGCAVDDGPLGPFIRVDAQHRTSMTGIFAAGDAAAPMINATLASAAGVIAGFSAHRSLAMPDA